MVRILAIGDSHIPRRAKEVPLKIIEKLKNLTKEELFDYTFFTGDVIDAPDFMELLTNITKRDLFIVLGNMDYYGGNRDAPIYRELTLNFNGDRRVVIGLTHGAQISPRGDTFQLEQLAIEKGYNVLISGHTHQEEITLTNNGILLLNPGSVTGAWSFIASGIPSFIVLNIGENSGILKVSLFRLKHGDIQETKHDYLFKDNKICTLS